MTRASRGHRPGAVAVPVLALAVWLAGCGDGPAGPSPGVPEEDLRVRFSLQTLGEVPRPPGDPFSAARVALGRLLFFDPILAGERDVSCAACHHPSFSFADGRPLSAGSGGVGLGPARIQLPSRVSGAAFSLEPRNAPTVLNAAFNGDGSGIGSPLGLQFWDGRALGLEEQARQPIATRIEMAGDAYSEDAARDSVVARLRAIPEYVRLFQEAFPEGAATLPGSAIVSMDTYGRTVAAYERELVTRETAFDTYVRGADGALTPQQKIGLELFFTRARCSSCHGGPMFSDFLFHVVGVPQGGPGKDILPGDDTGREEHTLDPTDRYAFRTPTLRNVELTAPYMHDGVFATLEEVVRFYDQGARPRHAAVPDALVDPLVRDPIDLTDTEIDAIVAFLRALTDPGRALDPALLTVPASVPSGLPPVFGVGASP